MGLCASRRLQLIFPDFFKVLVDNKEACSSRGSTANSSLTLHNTLGQSVYSLTCGSQWVDIFMVFGRMQCGSVVLACFISV